MLGNAVDGDVKRLFFRLCKDSIWFAVRDGKGFALRNLGAYLGRTDLKKSVSFFANRVPGTAPSYAAVRALQDYAERYVHA